jgi:hypothetical protein
MTSKFTVTYEFRSSKDGYLTKKTDSFYTLKDALDFARSVANTVSLVGKPLVEVEQ